ncbi:MAG: hypothetical protein AB1758_26605, partial [Candidatus Eremiobacterota bacterium]
AEEVLKSRSYRERQSQVGPVDAALVRGLLDALQAGPMTLAALARRLRVSEPALRESLPAVGHLLTRDGYAALSVSLDGHSLFLNQEALGRAFLEEAEPVGPERLEVETLSGQTLRLTVPSRLTAPERAVLEALARYGTLSEVDLARTLKTRRVGGLVETLLDKLHQAGVDAFRQIGEGPDGRIYSLEGHPP